MTWTCPGCLYIYVQSNECPTCHMKGDPIWPAPIKVDGVGRTLIPAMNEADPAHGLGSHLQTDGPGA
jgi:hypothetical protein